MFGAKPGVGSKPIPAVLKRFQEKTEEAGQTTFGYKNKSDSSPQANGTSQKTAFKPKPVGPPTVPDKSSTDQNQNVTKFLPQNRVSVSISSASQSGGSSSVSTYRKISVDEKSTSQNSVSKTVAPSNTNDNEPGKFDFRSNLKPTANRTAGAQKIEVKQKQRIPSKDDKTPTPPVLGNQSGNVEDRTSATSPRFGNKTGSYSPGVVGKPGSSSPGFGIKTGSSSPGVGGKPGSSSPGFGLKTGTSSPGVAGKPGSSSPGFAGKSGSSSPGFGLKTGTSSPGFGNKPGTTLNKSPLKGEEKNTVLPISENKNDENKPPATTEKKTPGPIFRGVTAKPSGPKAPNSNKRFVPSKAIVTRTDGKKFERLAKSSIITTELAPLKPLKPPNVNVQEIIAEYKKAFDEFKYANEELYDDVGNFIKPDDEVYDDVGNTVERRTSSRLSGRPVSEIPEWTEEEELGSGGSAAISVSAMPISPPPVPTNQEDELYDDGIAEPDTDELYEPLPDGDMDSGSGSVGDNSLIDKREKERLEKEAAEKRKKEEQERKQREKKEKQEQAKREKDEKAKQKEREKKEKEEKELRKKLKLIGDEVVEAQGTVKDKQKGGKLDLAVSAGQNVEIIRMTNNPKGKWLVRDELGHLGYVDSSNITIDTSTIRQQTEDLAQNLQALQIIDPPQIKDIGTDEMYEDLDGYQQDQEIYEECS